MPTTVQIPANGGSVPAKDFTKAAKSIAEAFADNEKNSDAEKAQVAAAVAAASAVVDAGHAGDENVYAVIGVVNAPAFTGGSNERIVSIGVYSRPAPPKPVAVLKPEDVPAPQGLPTPYETGPKPDEVVREAQARQAANLPNSSIEAVAADLHAPVPQAPLTVAELLARRKAADEKAKSDAANAKHETPASSTSTTTTTPSTSKTPGPGQGPTGNVASASTEAHGGSVSTTHSVSSTTAPAVQSNPLAAAVDTGDSILNPQQGQPSPYDAGSVKASDVQSKGTPSEGSSATDPHSA